MYECLETSLAAQIYITIGSKTKMTWKVEHYLGLNYNESTLYQN